MKFNALGTSHCLRRLIALVTIVMALGASEIPASALPIVRPSENPREGKPDDPGEGARYVYTDVVRSESRVYTTNQGSDARYLGCIVDGLLEVWVAWRFLP